LQLLLRLLLLQELLLLLPLQQLRSLHLRRSRLGLLRLCTARAASVEAATPLWQPPSTALLLVPGDCSLCNGCCCS
jgi:hypothetical protein